MDVFAVSLYGFFTEKFFWLTKKKNKKYAVDCSVKFSFLTLCDMIILYMHQVGNQLQ